MQFGAKTEYQIQNTFYGAKIYFENWVQFNGCGRWYQHKMPEIKSVLVSPYCILLERAPGMETR